MLLNKSKNFEIFRNSYIWMFLDFLKDAFFNTLRYCNFSLKTDNTYVVIDGSRLFLYIRVTKICIN